MTAMQERILTVRTVLAISATDLAQLLGTTVSAVCAYIAGKDPEGNMALHYRAMDVLSILCDKVAASEVPLPCNRILRIINSEGESLLQLLARGDLTDSELDAFVALEVDRYHENRRRLAASAKHRTGVTRRDPESISTPACLI